jgi:uncharacterized protein YqgC (DUF456 family)
MDAKDLISIVIVLIVFGFIGYVIQILSSFLFIGIAGFVVYKLLFSDNKRIER